MDTIVLGIYLLVNFFLRQTMILYDSYYLC
jgi:hypothetical protein